MSGGLGVFGGTFDPPHVAHLAIALAACESAGLERVLFVPALRSPLKEDGPVAGPEDRSRMVELAIAGEPRFALSRIELERDAPSFTVDTLERLAAEHPGKRLFLILGSDALADLGRWRRPERVRELATLLVAARPGAPPPDPALGAVAFDAPLLDLTARGLRARAAAGRSLRYLVPEPVWRYIEERGVYRAQRGSTSPRTT